MLKSRGDNVIELTCDWLPGPRGGASRGGEVGGSSLGWRRGWAERWQGRRPCAASGGRRPRRRRNQGVQGAVARVWEWRKTQLDLPDRQKLFLINYIINKMKITN